MGKSAIQWTQFTWNPLAGCDRTSPGCARCYARTLHQMRHKIYLETGGRWEANGKPIARQYAEPFEKIQLFPERLAVPLKRKEPTIWFVNSVSDLFHKDVPLDFIKRTFDVMNRADWHVFQVLTKRHERLAEIANSGEIEWTPNIWQGVSIENDRFTLRADYLRQVPAKVRFLSCEPLLSALPSLDLEGIHWVICGAESGKNARQMDLEWVRNLRDNCQLAGTPFFLKQYVTATGKKIGLPELDGRVWDQMPLQLEVAL